MITRLKKNQLTYFPNKPDDFVVPPELIGQIDTDDPSLINASDKNALNPLTRLFGIVYILYIRCL